MVAIDPQEQSTFSPSKDTALGPYDLDFEKKRIKAGEEKIKKELTQKWLTIYAGQPVFPQNFYGLSHATFEVMLSFGSVRFYNDVSKKFQFNQKQRELLPKAIWQSIIHGDPNSFLNTFQTLIGAEVSLDLKKLVEENIFLKIKEVAARLQPKQESIAKEESAHLPLLQAMSKYENLGNQLITGGRIRVKSQTEPVRPSLLYWLKYYRDELGIGQHSSVERGDFLFRSENGRKLSASERERVNLILKSVEENFPLSIDKDRQEIIFPVFQDVVMTAQKEFLPRPASMAYPALRDESPGERGEPAWPTYQTEFPPVSPTPLPPRPANSVHSDAPMSLRSDSGGAKTLGTPAFFVPKAEEGEPARGSYASSAVGGSRIERGAAFNIIKEAPAPSTLPPASPTAYRGGSAQIESVRPNAPRQNENHVGQASGTGEMSFSTSHIFPAEKEAAESRPVLQKEKPLVYDPAFTPVPKPASAPASQNRNEPPLPRPAPRPLSPFHIRPVSLGGKDWGESEDK